MRLVICDGNRILGEALAATLQARGHEVAAVATTASEGVTAVTSYQPDICILDLDAPDPGAGLEAIRAMRARAAGTAVLLISDLADPGIRERARRMGIAGLLCTDRSVSQIVDALHMVMDGERVFDRPPPGIPGPVAPPRGQLFVLTPREAEVLYRIVAGQGTLQMSREMNISISTVRTYVKNVLAKLGAHSRLEAAAMASRDKLLADMPVPYPMPQRGAHALLHSA